MSKQHNASYATQNDLSLRYIGKPIPLAFNDTAVALRRFRVRVIGGMDYSASVNFHNSVYWLTVVSSDGAQIVNGLGRKSPQAAKGDLDKAFKCAYYWEV